MTGLIIAMGSETKPILELMEITKQIELAGRPCYKGKIDIYDVCLITTDIGKVNASTATQAIIQHFPEVTEILNFGVAGAVNPALNIADICVVEKTVQYDFDVTAIDNVPLGYIQNLKQQFIYSDKKLYGKLMSLFNKTVTVATADRFSFSKEDSDLIKSLGADMRDMEVSAIYHTCALNKIPTISIKSVSDTAEGNPAEEFVTNLSLSTNSYKQYIPQILKILAENS